ncbi:hypothetical protein BDV32DRAFT_126504 [Aspergillus pseudonomiae]|nr:hypothetical protein BDV32DRAFT_126504 [Aspergillus pseudonomiae]
MDHYRSLLTHLPRANSNCHISFLIMIWLDRVLYVLSVPYVLYVLRPLRRLFHFLERQTESDDLTSFSDKMPSFEETSISSVQYINEGSITVKTRTTVEISNCGSDQEIEGTKDLTTDITSDRSTLIGYADSQLCALRSELAGSIFTSGNTEDLFPSVGEPSISKAPTRVPTRAPSPSNNSLVMHHFRASALKDNEGIVYLPGLDETDIEMGMAYISRTGWVRREPN